MTLVAYMQIFGVKDIKVYEFQKIPVAYFSDVIERECYECYIDIYKKIGGVVEIESQGNYYVIIVLTGGFDATKKFYD